MDPKVFELTMEQHFQLRLYFENAEKLDREEAINLLLEMVRQMMIKDNIIKDLMRKVL